MTIHSINCIEFNGGNTLKPQKSEPAAVDNQSEVKVYKLNPDGSKGELIRTDPAFPEGWDIPTFNSNIKEESIMLPRKDRDEIVATAKKLMTEGKSMTKAAEILKIPLSTLATWLSKDEKQKEPKKNYFGTPIIEPKADKPVMGCPFDEPVFNPDIPVDKPEPVPADYKNMNWMKRIDEYAMNNELAKLKIDFANLTLLSTLNDTMKLKVIEYIVRM